MLKNAHQLPNNPLNLLKVLKHLLWKPCTKIKGTPLTQKLESNKAQIMLIFSSIFFIINLLHIRNSICWQKRSQMNALKLRKYSASFTVQAANAAGDPCDKSIKCPTIQKVQIMPKFYLKVKWMKKNESCFSGMEKSRSWFPCSCFPLTEEQNSPPQWNCMHKEAWNQLLMIMYFYFHTAVWCRKVATALTQ